MPASNSERRCNSCGFLGEDSYWVPELARMKPEDAHKWLALWDPSVYLPRVKMPMLWVDGTNDPFYPMESLRKSYLLPKGPQHPFHARHAWNTATNKANALERRFTRSPTTI